MKISKFTKMIPVNFIWQILESLVHLISGWNVGQMALCSKFL